MAIASWSLVRVYGTWQDATGAMLPGKYTVSITARLTNSADDIIIPAGTFASGNLNSTPGAPSLSVLCPSTDDPDIQQTGWKVRVEVTFTGGQTGEKYDLDVPIANRPIVDGGNGVGVNLRTIALTESLAPVVALYGVGINGGLALLSSDGSAVLDASGNPIVTSGGTATWSTLSGKPAVIAAGADAAAARTAIGIVPATETTAGILEVATTGETTTGTLDNVIVTPLKLKAVADTKAAASHTHTAVDLPASVPHDLWQPSGGTWPARPTVATGARVNAIGYPGLTDVPSWLVAGTDSYTMRTA